MRVLFELFQTESVRVKAKSIAIASAADQQIINAVWPRRFSERGTGGDRIDSTGKRMLALGNHLFQQRLYVVLFKFFHRHTGDARGDLAQCPPVVALPLFQRKNRPSPFRHIAHRQVNIKRRKVGIHRMRRAGQDHVGMARGLVQVDVERDHELEAVKRLDHFVRVWVGQHRIAGHGDEGADLAFSRRQDFLLQRARRQRAAELGQSADAGLPAVHRRHAIDKGIVEHQHRNNADREHHAARPIHIARQHVDRVLQPTR